jgi:two-component system NtrC family sensor kinase
MKSAVIVPVEVEQRIRGVALAAFAVSEPPEVLHVVEALAEEVSFVLTARALQEQLEGAREELSRLAGLYPAPRDEPFLARAGIPSKLLQTEKMAALGQLVSGIAHELNNPLTSIMGYAQLLLSRGLSGDAAARDDAQRIFQEADRAGRIVKNLLVFARRPALRDERRPVDLNEIVERTLALRSYELKVEDIQVGLDLEPDLPLILADANQLQQAILNLVVNAEQAILQGRGHGHIGLVTRRLSEERILFEISDDGPGIPPDLASRIFDPFFTTKPPGVGTGLGLSIVYGIVQEHGGDIYLRPAATGDGGATFVMELPVPAGLEQGAEPSEPAVPATVARVPAAAPAAGPGPGRTRILVVEDEPTVAQLVADVLREEGHEVDAALDSQDGLNRLAREHYDLVVCDLKMPRLDGQAFFRALVRSGSPAQHRIVFITGDTLAPRTLQFLEDHDLPYLTKPFLVEELKLAVSRVLRAGGSSNGGGSRRPQPPPAAGEKPAVRFGGRKR